MAERMLPVSAPVFMKTIGVVEMLVGIAVLTAFTRWGAYIAMVWLLAIAVNLATMRLYDIAVRDVLIALSAFALARLTEARMVKPMEWSEPRYERIAA